MASLWSEIAPAERPVVCIQGIGFVGAAMAVAVASARDLDGNPWFDVVGVDLPTTQGRERIDALNEGVFPFETVDPRLAAALRDARAQGNLRATDLPEAFGRAAVTVVDVPLDVVSGDGGPTVDLPPFEDAIRTLGQRVPPGSLVIIETTVPPGTCDRVVFPALSRALVERGLPSDAVLLAHSYERVMPGEAYLDSITDFWRVYAGRTEEAADACEAFLSKVIRVDRYPLTRLRSLTASETGKVLENSYRAVTIAFMEEWGRFAEAVGIDLFEVLDAVRRRPTHNNIRQPGFGVGGYCLTKDPLLALIAARKYFGLGESDFPFCRQAVALNDAMPLVSLDKVQAKLGGAVANRRILLLGISYRQDVGDTRRSPSEIFAREAIRRGARLVCHDPLVRYWPELEMEIPREIPQAAGFDAAVFAVPHREYRTLDIARWLDGATPLIFDANNVLTPGQRDAVRGLGSPLSGIGRGESL